MANRFRRPKDKEYIFKRLVTDDDAPFETFKDLFIMAACIGYKNGERVEIPSGGEQIHWTSLEQNTDQVMINAIALCEDNDFKILLETEEATNAKFSLIEQYASAGLDTLKKALIDSPGDPLNNLQQLIFAQESNSFEQARSILGEIDLEL